MDVKQFEQLYNNDPNLRQMWTEAAQPFHEQPVDNPRIAYENIWVRQHKHFGKNSYSVTVKAGREYEDYNLNQKSRKENFSKWFMGLQADLQIARIPVRMSYWFCKPFNLGVVHQDGRLIAARLYFQDRFYSERIAANNKEIGGNKGPYREISFNKWHNV